ncbi:MAG: hypothetical protein ACT6QS_07075 [Flavobacteriales bacterium]
MSRPKPEILFCLILICLSLRLHARPEPTPAIPADGYITFKMALALGVRPRDLDYKTPDDLIGRYYTDRASGIITGCYMTTPPEDYFEQHRIFEARIENGRLQILNTYDLQHGNYSCCWTNAYDRFRRIGDLYVIRYCNTGSAFCAGHDLFFRRLSELQPGSGVLAEMYSGEEGEVFTLASRLQRHGDTLFFHYQWRNGVWEDEETLVYRDSAFFRVPFLYHNGEISCPDSSKLQQYGLDW